MLIHRINRNFKLIYLNSFCSHKRKKNKETKRRANHTYKANSMYYLLNFESCFVSKSETICIRVYCHHRIEPFDLTDLTDRSIGSFCTKRSCKLKLLVVDDSDDDDNVILLAAVVAVVGSLR